MSLRELLEWQYRTYPRYHRSRLNLLLHIVMVPLFVAGTVGAIFGIIVLSGSWFIVSSLTMVGTIIIEGLGHLTEPEKPAPFKNLIELFTRIFVEQWITFPKFVMSGGWLHALWQKQN